MNAAWFSAAEQTGRYQEQKKAAQAAFFYWVRQAWRVAP
jgi:hypothetical protein